MPHPLGLITLLTDFGDRDSFVASMKGVILSINPKATIVDLSHQIAPYAIEDASYLLKSCYRSFPAGTIHVSVVDPGVGSSRCALVVRSRRYFFLAPDNGLLTHVINEEGEVEARVIEREQYHLKSAGLSFDGRDLFAPAAAWLSKRQPFASYGKQIEDYEVFPISEPRMEAEAFVGQVVYVDRFGNLITNLGMKHLDDIRSRTKRETSLLRIAGHIIGGLVGSYREGSCTAPAALINSNGAIEIFVREGSAAQWLKKGRGELVSLS